MADIFPGILPDDEDRESFEPVSEIETGDTTDPAAALEAGECPWCDDYSGDHPQRHAPKAHPDEWDAYKDQED